MVRLLLTAALTILMPQSQPVAAEDTSAVILSLGQALEIALSESPSVKVADKEVEVQKWARKGTYASLFPQIDATGAYQRTIKKQIMSMKMGTETVNIAVGRWNTYNGSVSASMPLVNAQLWKSLKVSGESVELAVEKARSSRLEMVNQVKQAYYGVLLAKEANNVYKSVYDNAAENLELTQKKYNASRASELDLARAKTEVANAIPNLYDSANSIYLALWQLKAVIGMDLEADIDVADSLGDYAISLGTVAEEYDISNNSSLRQLEIQARQLADNIKIQQYAYLPSLGLSFNYGVMSMEDDFNFKQYSWFPNSSVSLALSIPIFSGGKRLSQVKQARLQAEELAIQRENAERQLSIAIRQYLSTMETATKSYASAQEALESAQKAYDIASKSYEVGRSTLTDLNAARLALTQAQLMASQAVYSYMVAKAGLESTIGADYQAAE
ncbi:MAG: TolC family protein [Bacteroidales bacterium]|nr:TolC family protein [Bacteroidales bacterium]